MTHRERVVEFWDTHINSWLAGDNSMPEPLPRWFASYAGKGRGAVAIDGYAEPYAGDLLGIETEPKLAVLGLNPGAFVEEFQSRTGINAREIRHLGSYSRWMTTAPVARDPWLSRMGRNDYFTGRLAFTGRWTATANPKPNDMLTFELYPWHSTSVTGPMRPSPDIIDQFVWKPVSELSMAHIFAFGKEWDAAARALGLPCIRRLGNGGEDYGSSVASRAVRVYGLPSGQQMVVEWHVGSAKPPSAVETKLLKDALC